MSTPFHEDMLMSFYDEEMASMKQSGMASLMTDAALIEHCEFIARQRFEDQLWQWHNSTPKASDPVPIMST